MIYSIVIRFASWIHRLGSRFIPKWKLQVTGQDQCFQLLRSLDASRRVVWFHCASLGEFEQCRPVIEAVTKAFPEIQVLLSFFSPSGYEVRKNYNRATIVVYLPWDTPANAHRFIAMARPSMAIFVKYEYWYNFFNGLASKAIPLISISSVFLPHHVFFRWYGGFFRSMLRYFNHFFVQDVASQGRLHRIGIHSVTVAGDTRFDRVNAVAVQMRDVEMAALFSYNKTVFVAGSIWKEDLDVLIPFIRKRTELRFIIAPHDVGDQRLRSMLKEIGRLMILYSSCDENSARQSEILFVDNVGMLSSLYRYGKFAWVGGAYSKGLHNILEAACYGAPVFFGNRNYRKFREANELVAKGGAFVIRDAGNLEIEYSRLLNESNYELASKASKTYVKENLGATEKILNYVESVLTLRAW